MATSFYTRYPASGANAADIETAIVDALTTFFPTNVLGQIYHDSATNNITTAFSEVGGAGQGVIPTGTSQIQVSSIIGKPLQLGIGATSGGATATFNLVAGGGPITFPVTFTIGHEIYVRTLDGSTVSTNYFVINFLG